MYSALNSLCTAIMSSTPKLGVSAQVASQHHGSITDLSHNSSTRTTIASRHRVGTVCVVVMSPDYMARGHSNYLAYTA